MKAKIRSILCVTLLLPLFTGNHALGQNSLPIKFQSLNNENIDTFLLNEILDSILYITQDLHLSIKYAELYESICITNPTIPNKLKRSFFLRGNRYNHLAWSNNQNNIELALKYIDTALYYHNQANSKIGYWQDQYGLGVIHRNKGENEKALEYFNEYLEYQSDPFDSIMVANVLFQICAVNLQMGQLDEATQAIVEAIRIEEALGRDYSLGSNYNALAVIKKKAQLNDEVIPIYNKALQIRKKIGDRKGQGNTLNNIGNFLAEQGDQDQAIIYFREAEAVAYDFESILGYIYEGMGKIYLIEERIDSAQFYLNKCYNLRKDSGSDREIYITEHRLGQLELLKKNYGKASFYFKNALSVAQEQGEIEKIAEITEDYSTSLKHQGMNSQALSMAYLYIESRDSLLSKEIAAQVEEIDTRYQTEKKEQKIALLNSQHELKDAQLRSSQTIMMILSLGILLLSGLLYRLYKLNQKVKKSEGEKDTLLREIHHRVKNNLQVISALLTLQSKYIKDDLAIEALQEGQGRVRSMALIHQDLYQHDNLKGVNTQDYFERLIDNLIQTYETEERNIEVEFDIEPMMLDVDTMIPLGLLVNELTSNALKHAFHDRDNGKIKITLKEENNKLLLEVKDNGKGTESMDMNNKSFGYSLIKSFARRLDADIKIENKSGLVVELQIGNYQIAV